MNTCCGGATRYTRCVPFQDPAAPLADATLDRLQDAEERVSSALSYLFPWTRTHHVLCSSEFSLPYVLL